MSSAKEVIVIGAGIIGASIAWHLMGAGARVTVISDSGAGGVATPNSFAWINASWGNPETYFRLRRRAMAEWTRLAKDLPGLPLAWCGGLCWDMPADELEAYAAEHSSWGYGIERVGRDRVARIEPNLTELPELALYVAEEGVAEPVAATRALLADAERRGAKLAAGTVTALVRSNGKVTGVEMPGEQLAADEVVIAAGAGAPGIAETVGVKLPIETPPGLIVHSRPYKKLLNGPVLAERLHMRQTAEGRIIAGSDFGGADPGENAEDTARELFKAAKTMLRGAEGLELDFHTVGYRPTPVDGFPIIGRAEGMDGLYVAVMHSGITLAPAVGLFATREILAGERDPLLQPYGLGRFSQ
ncbi:FAD-binding oxidoreductase [Mesorhizobium sp. M4B.F.Ca.ET.190.01.1.1]|uniref:NAD(P)/FAD-dependent oxidoreductase n=1 Tax=unclassified Mesorhizobium TaxID=325217 RepID=UPI000FE7D7A3|nr:MULTISPECIES: FAD-binding oxidoreductase [unclassified Mesorhizobium]RWA58766.1 MAG: FAD-binding oxidoreductase [Mesorhizobium sp.]RWF63889.1 MAG: FAD-binding oxidoreductase [Mesorhizobium sp.]TGR00795.1 FAD-binding oxidoreductase [Mesorhizobium sp. M4B.F.Ca.ET.200.01.1.1]TGS12572.1 FAD-binding oxidoreductase [Mesorhizobium sp. M4B.F.Ca.ET.190.01.1.1]TGT24804.1 FAD-binding oxidoreductase [Mesorhizobium sp. M4B.F.Ca.ET.172.01.1.1]